MIITLNVTKLKLNGNSYLSEIIVSPNNHNFKWVDDCFIVGKSDQNIDDHDVLIFARRNIEVVSIKSNIKIIKSHCFSHRSNLQNVFIDAESKLKTIGKYSFESTQIQTIEIPQHVTKIDEYAFSDCKQLQSVVFSPNSELQMIGIPSTVFSCFAQYAVETLYQLSLYSSNTFSEFVCLSETKFLEFVSSFDFNDMSGQLWQNLCQCFFPHPVKKCQRKPNCYNQQKKKREWSMESIIVGGCDKYNVLGEKPNNQNENISPIISPTMKSSIDPSSLLSYSAYNEHSVLVMNDGSLKGIGCNRDGRISSTLQKTFIEDFTDFCIKDRNSRQLAAVSAVCCLNGTLYMFSKSSGNERQLVLCNWQINEGDPVFLDIGNHHPVSLFGGNSHSAAIGSEGEVIFINRNSIINSPNSPIAAVYLPDREKASSVACCEDSVVVLSSNGRVFTSPIEEGSSVLNFSIVSELSGQEIVCVSGTYEHFLAVSKEGRVFGRGSNKYGILCFDKETESVSSFTEISSLVGYEIRAAYAGCGHSLFETIEGKILSCGSNYYGELLLSSDPSEDVYSPSETTITSGAAFCIAGDGINVIFIGSSPPPNTPNMRIDEYE